MKRRRRHAIALAAAWAVVAATAASAHSVKELELELGDREKYFQPLDKAAPEFTLAHADGAPVRLADFRGEVVVLHFIYAACSDVCPLHTDLIADVQAKINQTPMKEAVRFVTVTTDPSKDVPEVMRAYGPAHGLDVANWVFLTTLPDQPESATRGLAEAYGHKFSRTPEGSQVHGVVTHVIDKEGRWRANFHGLKLDPTSLVLFVNALVNDVQKPHGHRKPGFWDRVRELF